MTITSVADDRVISEIEHLCHMGFDTETLSPRVAERLRHAVPFDGYAVVTLDPLSSLATNFHFSEEMGSQEDARFFLENIYFEDRVISPTSSTRSGSRVGGSSSNVFSWTTSRRRCPIKATDGTRKVSHGPQRARKGGVCVAPEQGSGGHRRTSHAPARAIRAGA